MSQPPRSRSRNFECPLEDPLEPEENRGLVFQVQTVMGERGALLLSNDDYWPPSMEVGDMMLDRLQCK